MSFWCSHEDDLIDKTVLPSPWEQIVASGRTVTFDRMEGSIHSKTVLYVFKCKKCGRSRVHKESSA